jgi:6-phosphogluconate dehydrogenase
MQIGMIGLGRMGGNMVRRLIRGGHSVVVNDRTADKVRAFAAAEGATAAVTNDELIQKLSAPRAIWIMLPAEVVDAKIDQIVPLLSPGDIIIDGGNSRYLDDARRAAALRAKGLEYVDVGTSGGVWGLERGYCLMIGGTAKAVQHLDPIFKTLAPGHDAAPRAPGRSGSLAQAEHGYLHCGSYGAGHFVKMVHNAIEYGIMAAYAEGFNVMKQAEGYDFNLPEVAELWRRGSVIGSWLLDLTGLALAEDQDLKQFAGRVGDSGEGRWTLHTAIDAAVPVPVLAASLFSRFSSRGEEEYANRLLSAMRAQFGGHKEEKA